MSKVRVIILGYGVIGKRLADAVRLQDDMAVVGVAGRSASFSLRDAQLRGFDVYLTDDPKPSDASSRLCAVRGSFRDLVKQSEVVLDCTPRGVPAAYLDIYEQHEDLVTIVQGGENHDFAGTSFNSFANYDQAAGKKRVRVISCSSTGTTRFVYTMDRAFGLERAFVTVIRRAADPGKPSKNPINALSPTMGQSHHAPDVKTVLPHLKLYSMAVDSSTTFSHVVNFQTDLRGEVSREEVIGALDMMPRVVVGEGLRSTADLAEYYRDLGRSRADRPEIYVWKEGIRVEGKTVYTTISVHMESITIPETIDCIRAALGLEQHNWTSIYKTDRALGITKSKACYRR